MSRFYQIHSVKVHNMEYFLQLPNNTKFQCLITCCIICAINTCYMNICDHTNLGVTILIFYTAFKTMAERIGVILAVVGLLTVTVGKHIRN